MMSFLNVASSMTIGFRKNTNYILGAFSMTGIIMKVFPSRKSR